MEKFNVLEWLYEYWVPANGYDGYEVSNWGRVRSLDRRVPIHHNSTRFCKGELLKGEKCKFGYIRVNLKNRKRELVHRLVAEAFIPNPKNFPCVNHKSENPSENFVWNLEWCTHRDNNLYNNGMGRRLEVRKKRGTKKTDPKPIVGVSIKDGTVIRFESGCEAQRNGFHNVHLVIEGRRPTCKGYKWYYDQ